MLAALWPFPGLETGAGGYAASFDHSDYDEVLRRTVTDGRVDYPAIRESHLAALDAYLKRAADLDAAELQEDDRLAFYINVYNAAMLRTVASRYRPGYSVEENSFGVFDEPLLRLHGGKLSLNQLEHDVIRREFAEPRIHVALVCAARSCPPLRSRAYTGDDLDTVLEAAMRTFLNDPSRNRIDPGARRLHLSRIFDWFPEDFGGRDALARYVDRYTETDVSGFEVTFDEYSWKLND